MDETHRVEFKHEGKWTEIGTFNEKDARTERDRQKGYGIETRIIDTRVKQREFGDRG